MKKDTIEILKQGKLSEGDIRLLARRLNDEKTREATQQAFRDSENEVWGITPEQTEKGKAWLLDQWKTPRGVERKNNPFGYREEEALEFFDRFTFDGFYDAGNVHHSWFTPIYTVHGKKLDGSGEGREVDLGFQYVMKGGEISIIG